MTPNNPHRSIKKPQNEEKSAEIEALGKSKSIFKFITDIVEMLRLNSSENKLFSSYDHFSTS